jgi:hypothetical protein
MNEFDEEDAYNAEVLRLINEGIRCPICNAQPNEIEAVEAGRAAAGRCTAGHYFLIEQEDADD